MWSKQQYGQHGRVVIIAVDWRALGLDCGALELMDDRKACVVGVDHVSHNVGNIGQRRCCRWPGSLGACEIDALGDLQSMERLTVHLHTAEKGRVACHPTAHVGREGVDGRKDEQEHQSDEEDRSCRRRGWWETHRARRKDVGREGSVVVDAGCSLPVGCCALVMMDEGGK